MDRMRGQATKRISAQREADAAVTDRIRLLRNSSTLTVLRDQINLGPSKAAVARTTAAVAAARRAAPPEVDASRSDSVGSGSGEQPLRPWSSSVSGGGSGGGVPLQLSLGPGPVQTLPHNVLRESLSRLEGMLSSSSRPGTSGGSGGASSSRPSSAGVVGPAAAASPGAKSAAVMTGSGGKATARPSSREAIAVAGGKADADAAGNTAGGGGTAAGRPSRPTSGCRPGSASGRPPGAVIAAAKAATVGVGKGTVAAVEAEAERLAGDDAGTEGLYSDDEEPAAVAAAGPDFGFMFKSSMPPNPFGRGGAGPKR